MNIQDLNIGDTFSTTCDGATWQLVHIAPRYKRGGVCGQYYAKPLSGPLFDRFERSKELYPQSYEGQDGRTCLNRNLLVTLLEKGPQRTPKLTFGKHKGKAIEDVDKDYL